MNNINNIDTIYQLFRKYPKVSTDSRDKVKGSIFFALSGEHFDGNRFAADALKKGAAVAVVDNNNFVKGTQYILVDNTLKALQQLAKRHLEVTGVDILSITGTNGKTTTKELVSSVLSTEKKIHHTRENLNNHIGVPLTILGIEKNDEIAVVEMGANHPGEIKELCDIASPRYGLITNIGKAHLEGFGNLEGVINTKKELYDSVAQNKGVLFVNADDRLLMKLSGNITRFTYGKKDGSVNGELVASKPFISVKWYYEKESYKIDTKLYGSYNFYNVMAAVAAGVFFGISPQNICRAIENYTPGNNRSQVVKTNTNTVILDAYNANPVSMTLAIEDFSKKRFNNPVLILGDMFELGAFAAGEHRKIIDLIKTLGFGHVILAGEHFYHANSYPEFHCFGTTKEAAGFLKKNPVENSTVLIKGSRGMQMEQLVQLL